jgi:type IV secretory pathway VirB10-like protein
MLPDIRAVVAAMVAAVGLLMISFGLTGIYRTAQHDPSGSLQADLAQRGQSVPPPSGDRAVPIIESAPPVEAVAATVVSEPEPPAPPQQEAPRAEPPIGGPLVTAPENTRSVAAENPTQIDTRALQRAAAEKARKAHAARVLRERKAAARRAAQARRARQRETPNFGSFGGTFTTPTTGR